jgi:hypothetical protein
MYRNVNTHTGRILAAVLLMAGVLQDVTLAQHSITIQDTCNRMLSLGGSALCGCTCIFLMHSGLSCAII